MLEKSYQYCISAIMYSLFLVLLMPVVHASTKITLEHSTIKRNDLVKKVNNNLQQLKSENTKSDSKNLGYDSNLSEKIGTSLIKTFDLSGNESLKLDRRSPALKSNYLRFQQTYKGIPVEGGFIIAKSDQYNTITHLSGTYYANLDKDLSQLQLHSEISNDQLQNIIKEQYQNGLLNNQSWIISRFDAQPVIAINTNGKPYMAYKITFLASNNKSLIPKRPVIYFDPAEQKIVTSYDNLTMGREAGSGEGGNPKIGPHFYSSTSDIDIDGLLDTFVIDRFRSWGRYYCDMDADGVITIDYENKTSGGPNDAYRYDCPNSNQGEKNTSPDSVLNDAHYHAQVTNRMYQDYLGFKPLGNHAIKQRVHYGENFNNAFWDGDYVTYGDGGNIVYPMVVLDVAAHEITHGYIERYADLGTQGQSGALNESIADIAGEAAEYYFNPEKQRRWDHNYDAYRREGAVRYFKRPSDDGRSIDTALHFTNGMNSHFASGVFNRAFYLLVNPDSLYPQHVQWDVPMGFKVFALAVKNCFFQGINFTQAAQCVVSQAEEIAPSINTQCNTSPFGDSCKRTIFTIQNDIRRVFAIVDVDTDIEDRYKVDTFAKFNYTQSLANTHFTNTSFSETGISQIHWDFGDGNSQTVTSDTNTVNHTYQQSGRYWVAMKVTDNNNNTDTFIKEIYVDADYCSATGQSSSKRWISEVKLNDKSRASGKNGYGNFTDTVFVAKGNSLANIQLTADHEPSEQSDRVYWAIWIDNNNDGRFSQDEKVYTGDGAGTTTGQFTVPALANNTTARMRVIMRWIGSPPTSCGNIGTGEVEDYSLKVSDEIEDYYVDFNFEASGLDVTFTNTSNMPINSTWNWDFGDTHSDTLQNTTHSYDTPGSYNVTLSASLPTGDPITPKSKTVVVSNPLPGQYCDATSTSTEWELIQRVMVSNVDNTSGATSSGYQHYTDEAISVISGQTYDYAFTPWYKDSVATLKYWRAWIDFDGDQQFEDSELILDGRISTDYLEGSFTVPQTDSKTTRMRVILRHLDKPEACGEFGGALDGGEVEDYDVQISN